MENHGFDPNMLFGAGMLAVMGIAVLAGLAISLFICWLLYGCFEAVPEKYRALSPGQVWLLMIPLFNIIWNFWVFPGLSKSYQAYFDSVGDTSVGDCYAQVAQWLSICGAVCFVPCLGGFAGMGYLVLLIIYLIRAIELKNKILAA